MCRIRENHPSSEVRFRQSVSSPSDDRSWVQAASAGSSAAFSHLVGTHQAGLIAFLRRLCIDLAEAEDIAQETFLLAWRSLSRFDPDRSFRAWLFGIGWRKCRESRRGLLRRLHRQAVAVQNTPSIVTPDPSARLDLSEAINLLPSEERAAVLLCLMAGFSHEEASQIMNVSPRKLKSLIFGARQKLIQKVGNDDA